MSNLQSARHDTLRHSTPYQQALLEGLEPRLMLDGAFGDSFSTTFTSKLTILDENDNTVTFKVKYAEAILYTSEVDGGEILGIDIHPDSEKAYLKISNKYETSIGDINVYGSLSKIYAPKANLDGDLAVEGWATKITLGDIAAGSQVQILTDGSITPSEKTTLTFQADEIADCDFATGILPIKSLKATTYLDGSLTSQYFGKIAIKGDFGADLSALDQNTKSYSLYSLTALSADGATLNVPGGVNSIKTTDWTGGSIDAGWMNKLTIGNSKNLAEVSASLTLSGDNLPDKKATLSKVTITGELVDTNWSVDGYTKKITVKGDTDNWTISDLTELDAFKVIDAVDTIITVDGDSGKITATSWTGGGMDADSASTIKIKTNLDGAEFSFDKPVAAKTKTLAGLAVSGEITETTIRSAGDIGYVKAALMQNSALLVGIRSDYDQDNDSDGVLDLPGDASDFDAPVDGLYPTLQKLTIAGAKGITDDLLENSTIAAASIKSASVKNINNDNDGFFGVMFKDIVSKFVIKQNNRSYRYGADNWPDTGWFVIADVDENHPPKVTDDIFSTVEDTDTVSGNVLANDDDLNGDSFDVISFTQAAHGTVGYNGSGEFSYSPDADYNGADSFTYTIEDDGGEQTTGTINVTISAVNDAPRPETDAYTTDEDQAISITDALDNDVDVEGDEFSIVAFTQASNGSVSRTGTTFTYTPDANFSGADSFTYTIRDTEGDSAATTVTITVNSLNDAPTAVDDSFNVDEDTLLVTTDLTANDSDPEGDAFTIISFTQPSHGSLTDNGDGTFDYTPTGDYFGTDSFTYTISDGNDSSTASVNITIDAVNDAPVAVDDEDYTTVNNPRTTDNVLANDTDADNDALSVFGYTQPSHGSVVYNDDGTFTYTPATDYSGDDSFTYTVTDSNGGTDTATVSITINDVPNNLPQGNNDSFTSYYNSDYTTTDVLANDTDADGHTLSITGFTQATHGTVAYNDDGTFTYSLTEYFAGDDTFTYTISDGHGGTDTATVTITKPEVTIDVLGAPTFDGSEVSGLTVYRLRATQESGDNFDLFMLNQLANTHQLWSNAMNNSIYASGEGLTDDQNNLDTHFMFSATDIDLSMPTSETNGGTNPTGGDYTDGGVTPITGLGTFEMQGMSLHGQFTSASYQFVQIVLPNDVDVTISGRAYKTISTTYSVDYSFDIAATEDPGPNNAPVAADESFETYSNADFTTTDVLANDTDSDSDDLSITSFTQATHGTVTNNGDGTFTYALTENYAGDDTFTYTISDGNGGSDTATVTITRPKITIDNLGTPTLDGVDIDGLTVYRLRVTSLVGEDMFDTFAIDEMTGVHQVWSDGSTASPYNDTTTIGEDYSDLDTHFMFTSDDVFFTFGITETNDAGNPISVSTGSNTIGIGTFELTTESLSPLAVELSYQFMQIVVPNTLNLTVTGQAVQGASSLDFSIDIVASGDAGENVAPSAGDDNFETYLNSDFTTTNVLANDTDGDGHSLTITSFTQPTHGTVVYNDDGTFTYTLTEHYAGDDTFTYTVSDGHGASDVSTVTITKPQVTLDVLGAPIFDGSEITGLTVYRLRATKLSGDNFDLFKLDEIADTFQLWASAMTKSYYVSGVGLTEQQAGLDTHFLFPTSQMDWLSMPVLETNDQSNPFSGDYTDEGVTPLAGLGTFELQGSALDGYYTSESAQFAQIVLPNTVSATFSGRAYKTINTTYYTEFSFDIAATEDPTPNTAPSAVDENFETYKNEPYTTANVLANDTDANSDTLSVSSFTQPDHGTVVYNDDGTFTYTLTEHFAGDDTFTYTVSDGRGGTDIGTVTITKPKITLDTIGSPSLDDVEIPGLTVYRLRCTAMDGEDYFDTFQINEMINTHQVWGLGGAQTTRLDAGLLDSDWLDFDTHMLVSSSDSSLSFGLSESNDGTNPSGQTFDNGSITGTAGMGSYEVQALAIDTLAIPGQSYQFLQIVVRNTDTVTVSGVGIQYDPQTTPQSSFSITLD